MTDIFARIAMQHDQRPHRAGQVDYLLSRLNLLEPQDRVLLELHFAHQVNYNQLAHARGTSPKTIARQVRSLTRRLMADDYVALAARMDDFTTEELAVAYDHYLLGLGYRSIARKRQLAQKQARRVIRRLDEWLQKHRSVRELPS